MQVVDYNNLLSDERGLSDQRSNDQPTLIIDEVYRDRTGVQFRDRGRANRHFREIVRIADDAIVLSTDCLENAEANTHQIVRDNDWVHIQFRLDGNGYERCSDGMLVETPPKSCIVTRYPKNSIIERKRESADRWRYVCLFMSPHELGRLLDAKVDDLPDSASWLGDEGSLEFNVQSLPLHPAMAIVVNDLLTSSLSGSVRRAFVRGKSIELLSLVLQGLSERDRDPSESNNVLSAADLARISRAWSMLSSCDEAPASLGDLARRVGLNRSKLASGFKSVYGVPVRRFWRDMHLDQARTLIQRDGISVTEAALMMGYSDPYSFTRAFRRRFGILPRDCKVN